MVALGPVTPYQSINRSLDLGTNRAVYALGNVRARHQCLLMACNPLGRTRRCLQYCYARVAAVGIVVHVSFTLIIGHPMGLALLGRHLFRLFQLPNWANAGALEFNLGVFSSPIGDVVSQSLSMLQAG